MVTYLRDDVLRHFQALAREVGGQLELAYGLATGVKTKEDRSVVCDQDLFASRHILNHFSTFFPEAGVLEEETRRDDRAEREQCLGADGLDYSRGFIRGDNPDFAVLLFLLEGFRTVVAVSYKPMKKEMLWAVEGQGAYLESGVYQNTTTSRITVADSDEMRLITSRSRGQEQIEQLVRELDPITHTRMGGSAKYLEIAKGNERDEIITVGCQPPGIPLNPWDLGVLPLIIGEAGGIVKTVCGEDLSLAKRPTLEHIEGLVIANNLRNYEKVQGAIRTLGWR